MLAWGVASIVLPTHYVTTVRPLDAVLVAVAAYLWVPALGLLLVGTAGVPSLAARTSLSTLWAVAVSWTTAANEPASPAIVARWPHKRVAGLFLLAVLGSGAAPVRRRLRR